METYSKVRTIKVAGRKVRVRVYEDGQMMIVVGSCDVFIHLDENNTLGAITSNVNTTRKTVKSRVCDGILSIETWY